MRYVLRAIICVSATATAAVADGAAVVFNSPTVVNPSVGVGRLAIADFNLDERPDLAVIEFGLSVGTFLSDEGALSFQPVGLLPGQPFDPQIAAADLNNDGLPDIVAVTGAIEFQTFIQQPGGTFQQSGTGIPGEFYFPTFVLGQMNDDAFIDLVTANPQGVHLNDGSGQFVTVGGLADTPIFSNLHAANLDPGGLTDVLRTTGLPTVVQVLRNDGDGVLTLSATVSAPTNTASAGGDFNADGVTDIAMIDYAPANAIVVRFGQPAATLGPPVAFSTGPYPSAIAAGDVNNDGFDDIIVAMSAAGGVSNIRVYASLGNGTFALAGSSPVPVDDSGGGGPHIFDMATADFDRDGRTDLAAAAFGYGLVLVFNVTPFGDLDGDGDADLDDFPLMAACLSGPAVPAPNGCAATDLDADNDVDVADVAVFQNSFGEP